MNHNTQRKSILAAIRAHQPDPAPLPEIPEFLEPGADLKVAFTKAVQASGGAVLIGDSDKNLDFLVRSHFSTSQIFASPLAAIQPSLDINPFADLASIDVAVIQGKIGVAENGAVWITEEDSVYRVLPFITQHLVVVLSSSNLVWNMHDAYEQVQIDETGFGVFIAGPSKTADIEQSLVVGAHGARSFTVVLMN